MKKNFKKSKFVILPALATLVLTGVASVTGTVAWFTANRAASVTASQFTATAMDSNMKVTMTAITGTTSASSTTNSGSITVDGTLTHGSFDADATTQKGLYTALTSDSYVTGYQNVGNFNNDTSVTTWQAGTVETNKKVWYAVSWKMTFKVTLGSDSEKVAVLFNPATSRYSSAEKVHAGLKTAMFTSDNLVVFGNDSVKTHVKGAGNGTEAFSKTTDTDVKTGKEYYTQNEDTTTYSIVASPVKDDISTYYEKSYNKSSLEESFQDTDYLQTNLSYSPLADKATTLTSANEYLGTIDSSNKNDGLSVYCVAWYEGTDAAVINENVISDTMSATLNFYCRVI